ncbi:MAG: putative monovalent cation/H+ antiporter subunit A [Armatimonadetes bacterium]|nr:putative monovalent cation/H+ antiporter subunit A [Armatimonadota bacterium]
MTSLVLCGFVLALAAPAIHRVARGAAGYVLALYPFVAAIVLAVAGQKAVAGQAMREALPWASELGLSLSFSLDGLSLLFGLMISGIGVLVLIYAGGYLKGHPQLGRFYAYLLLFMASMLGLVLADNLLALFVFWEGTSISSYLLIGFNHRSETARKAALQALLVTGGGGLALLGGLLLLGIVGGNWEMSALAAQGDLIRAHAQYGPILILVLVGAFTKSAQFPFHFWLPNAMEAPTPVSAYLHSATMVKAGIYLLARLSPTLGGTEMWTSALTLFGGATMIVGGVLALLQTDIKRLLAYSTISALGTLTLLLGIGTTAAIQAFAVFLLAHALYKGALFMVAGTLDHETGTRDLEKMGGLRRVMPITAAMAILAAVSLAGVGPLFSFIGKELLFEAVLESEHSRTLLVGTALLSGAFFVAAATIVAVKPFFGALQATPKAAHEAPPSLWLGPVVLAPLGLILGISPGFVTKSLLSPAIAAILGRAEPLKLSLWHGFNAALALSGASLLLGLLAYASWPALRRAQRGREVLLGFGPARWYEVGLFALNRVASLQTRLLQNGYLRAYVMTIIVTTTALAGYTLLTREGLPALLTRPLQEWDVRFYEAALAALIVLAAYAAVRADSRLAALAALGVVGYCVSLIYLFFGAPDLAMTQVLVDTLTVILFVLVFYHLPRFASLSGKFARVRDAAIAICGGALMTTLVLVTNTVTLTEPISGYFLENSLPKGYGRNIVNVILVDFRALDTLGEITVLSLAGIGVFALLKLRPHREEKS